MAKQLGRSRRLFLGPAAAPGGPDRGSGGRRTRAAAATRRGRTELFVLLVVARLVALAPLARRHLLLIRHSIRDGARPRARHVEHTVERAAARRRAQRVRLVRPLGARRGLFLFALALAFMLIPRFGIEHRTLVLALGIGIEIGLCAVAHTSHAAAGAATHAASATTSVGSFAYRFHRDSFLDCKSYSAGAFTTPRDRRERLGYAAQS